MKRWRYAPCIAVAALAAGLYLPTLRFGFVLDDKHLIVDNTFVREAWSPLRAFAHHFWYGSTGAASYYRPLVTASVALNGRLLGWEPPGFHYVNILLHSVNVLVVMALLRRLGIPRRAAIASGALLAVHPAASWAVASIVARVDLLPALFVLLAWWAHAAGADGEDGGALRAWKRAFLVGLLFLCALLSKESALAFLVVLLMGLRRMSPRRAGAVGLAAPRSNVPTVIAAAVAVAASFGLRRLAGAGMILRWDAMDPFLNPLAGVPFPGRLADAVRLTGRYILYLFVPVRFADPTNYAASPGLDAGAVLAALGLLAIGAGVFVLWVRRDPLALPLGFSLAAFLPASNLIVPIASLYALNFLYMPLVGLSLACGEALTRLEPDAASRAPAPGRTAKWPWLFVPVAILLAAATVREAGIWRDGVALAGSWIDRFPHYAFARGSLGVALLDRGDPGAAVPELRRAIAMDDRSAETRFNLGLALALTASDSEGLEDALRSTRSALNLNPDYTAAHVNASQILLRLERYAEAETEARAALDLAPGHVEARLNLAEALVRQARTGKAEAEFLGLQAAESGDPRLRSSYLLFLIESGDRDRARSVAERSRRDFPGIVWFDFWLARIEAASGHEDLALSLLRAGLAKAPEARDWIARAEEFRSLRGNAAFEELTRP